MKISLNQQWNYTSPDGETILCDLPFDAMLRSRRSKDSHCGGSIGYFDGGVYRYSKSLSVPKDWLCKDIYLEFEGVYRNATVSINGIPVAFHAYGYTEFIVEISRHLHEGENDITIVADNSKAPNSRWYSGGGIYRDVYLYIKDKGGNPPHSLKVKTLSINPVTLSIGYPHAGHGVRYEIYKDGILVNSSSQDTIVIADAALWDEDNPNLYVIKAMLFDGDVLIDEEETTFGIRDVRVDQNGLFINGKKILLRGGCVHHDNGILGASSFKEAEFRKAKILKKNGFNAVRCAHNPCSRHFLDACDFYGIYVMDEAFDMWYSAKKEFDYSLDFASCHEEDLKAMVNKNYNHPCVIMYSIGNEISEPATPKGLEVAKSMVNLLHSLDPSRFITAGANALILQKAATGKSFYLGMDELTMPETSGPISSEDFNRLAMEIGPKMNEAANGDENDRIVSPFVDLLDIAGYNYGSGKYQYDAEHHPNRVVVGAETFPGDIYKNWKLVERFPQVIGDFMWTAIDYLGEVGLGAWVYDPNEVLFEKPFPWILAESGAIDLIGVPTAETFLAKVAWGLCDKPLIAVRPIHPKGIEPTTSVWRGTNAIPSWSWQGCNGKPAHVEVYGAGSAAALYLNDELLERKPLSQGVAHFKTLYKPGTLQVIMLDEAGNTVSKSSLISAKKPCRIELKHCKTNIKEENIHFIEVSIVDENGVIESNADTMLEASANTEILAFGSADPKPAEPYFSSKTKTHYGRALLVVRSSSGKIKIRVSSNEPKCGELEINPSE